MQTIQLNHTFWQNFFNLSSTPWWPWPKVPPWQVAQLRVPPAHSNPCLTNLVCWSSHFSSTSGKLKKITIHPWLHVMHLVHTKYTCHGLQARCRIMTALACRYLIASSFQFRWISSIIRCWSLLPSILTECALNERKFWRQGETQLARMFLFLPI